MIDLTKLRSKTLVTSGFVTMLLLLAAFVGLWVSNLTNHKEIVHQLNSEQSNARSVLTLHYILTEQQQLLDQIKASQSSDDQQQQYVEFKRQMGLLESVVFNADVIHDQFNISNVQKQVQDFIIRKSISAR